MPYRENIRRLHKIHFIQMSEQYFAALFMGFQYFSKIKQNAIF